MEIYSAILAGLGGMFGWGLSDFFAKKSIDKLGDIRTLLWAQIFGILPAVLLLVFLPEPVNLGLNILFFLFAFAIGDCAGFLFFYKGLEKGMVSILSPVFAVQSGVAVLVSALIFGEQISQLRWIGLALAFVGVLLISFQPPNKEQKLTLKNISKGLPETIAGMIIFGFYFPAWDWFLGYQGSGWIIPGLVERCFFVAILFLGIYLLSLKKKEPVRIVAKEGKLWFWLILVGLFDIIAALSTNWGYKFTTLTSVIVVLMGAFPLVTVVAARIFLKEKLTKVQIFGVAIIIIGTIVLSF